MALFDYRAMDDSGAAVAGTIVAETPRQARDQLRRQGLSIEHVTAVGNQRMPWLAVLPWRRRSSVAVVTVIRELSTLLAVGVTLADALQTLADQHTGPTHASLLLLRDRVAAGESLAEAMRQQADVFDPLSISMVEVGQNVGTLDEVLERLAQFKERSRRLRSRISTALLYPLIVLGTGVGVAIFLMTFVVPRLLMTLTEAGVTLPLATRVVKGASDLLLGYWSLLIVIAGVLVLATGAALRSERGRIAWHRLQLRLPLIGPMVRKQEIMRIAVVMSTLLHSGVVFLTALRIAQATTRNVIMRQALERCEHAVHAGTDIAAALQATGAFPPMVIQIFSVGQHSGRLEQMLERLAEDYDQQLQTASQRLTSVLEPILILILAVLVGLIAFATMMPILEAGNVL